MFFAMCRNMDLRQDIVLSVFEDNSAMRNGLIIDCFEANCGYLKVGERQPNMRIDDSGGQLRFA